MAMQVRRHLCDKFKVQTQKKQVFWKSKGKKKRLKPDIILTDRPDDSKVIIDTKWKIPNNMVPGDADLRQMFAYNRLFGSKQSILLYPGVGESVEGVYQTEYGGECRLVILPIVDGRTLIKGEKLIFEIKRHLNNTTALGERIVQTNELSEGSY